MRAVAMSGFKNSQMVAEYHAASAMEEIIYPGIQQCVSITGFSDYGLVGAHVSPGSTREETDAILTILRSGGIKNSRTIYIVGNMTDFFGSSTALWKKKSQMVDDVKKHTDTSAGFLLKNTSGISKDAGGWGIDIRAQLTGGGVDFTYRPWPSRSKNGAWTAMDGHFEKFT